MEITNLIVAIISIFISGFISYHVLKLSKSLSFSDKRKFEKAIKNYVDELNSEIHYKKRRNAKTIIIDVDMYDKYYPENWNKFGRHSHFAGEIKGYGFKGVEIIVALVGVKKLNGRDYEIDNESHTDKAVKVGIIPYEWIEYMDLNGDAFNTSPLIYCKFRNKSKWQFKKDFLPDSDDVRRINKRWHLTREWSPLKYTTYYLLNPQYNKEQDHYWDAYRGEINIVKDLHSL